MRSILYLLLLLLISRQAAAQITYIPDPVFERFLISQNIDSDGEINGQVLTSDIENITELIILGHHGWGGITDLSGIEGFVALEKLSVEYTYITTLNITHNIKLKELSISHNELSTIDLSKNTLLERIYCGHYGLDVGPFNQIEELDLSQNPNIRLIDAYNTPFIKKIYLNNNNNNPDITIILDLYPWGFTFPDYDRNEIRNTVCIQVDNPTAAENTRYPYSHWRIAKKHVAVFFSDNCTLNTSKFETKQLAVYPNPTTDILHLDVPQEINVERLMLFDALGKKVLDQPYISNAISVSELTKGIYLLKIVTKQGTQTQKIIIN